MNLINYSKQNPIKTLDYIKKTKNNTHFAQVLHLVHKLTAVIHRQAPWNTHHSFKYRKCPVQCTAQSLSTVIQQWQWVKLRPAKSATMKRDALCNCAAAEYWTRSRTPSNRSPLQSLLVRLSVSVGLGQELQLLAILQHKKLIRKHFYRFFYLRRNRDLAPDSISEDVLW